MTRRILLLNTDLEIGGTPTVVRELAVRLSRGGGAEVEVACLGKWGPVADELKAAGIPVTAFAASSPWRLPAVVFHLAQLLKRRRIDTLFSFLVHANLTAALSTLLAPGVRRFQSIQTTQPYPAWHWKVQRLAGHWAEKVIVPSESVAEAARKWAKTPTEKIIVIPNAVDVEAFAGLGSRVVGPHPRIGFIGRLDPIKRIGDLLAAMPLLDATISLDIYGEGADRPNIEKAISRLGLTDRVSLHGAISRPQSALGQMDVLVLTSQAEGFGLVLIEAMAAGVPVIGTDVPGICNVIRKKETGLLVPVGSPEAIAEGVKMLLGDEVLRRRLAAAALADVKARFGWAAVLKRYQEVLEVDPTESLAPMAPESSRGPSHPQFRQGGP